MLLAQRVDRTWHSTILTSPKLQSALFFKPVKSDSIQLQNSGCDIFDCSEDRAGWRKELGALQEGDSGDKASSWHWVLTGVKFVGPILVNAFVSRAVSDFSLAKSACYRGRPNSLWQPEASWRRMLYAQPPMKKAIVDYGKCEHWHVLHASDPNLGITMGDVYNAAAPFGTKDGRINTRIKCFNLSNEDLYSHRWSTGEYALSVLAEMKS